MDRVDLGDVVDLVAEIVDEWPRRERKEWLCNGIRQRA
jgi:hypothetical protein